MQKAALAHVERAGGIGAVGRDGVVSVVRVKAMQQQLFAVGFVIAVFIHQQDQIRLFGDIDAFGRDLEADGQMQAVGEGGLLVGATIAIGVFEDDQFVVRRGVAGFPMRVAGHDGDPEAALVVEAELDGIFQVGELGLGSEQVHLVTLGHGEAGERLLDVFVLDAAHFAFAVFGIEVGGHRGEGMSGAIVHAEVGLLAGGEVVDELVAQGHHLAGLADFVGVILRAVGVVALAVAVDAVDEVVVVVPKPVLLLHRGVDLGRVGLGLMGLMAVEAVGEMDGEFLVSGFGGGEAVDGEGGSFL